MRLQLSQTFKIIVTSHIISKKTNFLLKILNSLLLQTLSKFLKFYFTFHLYSPRNEISLNLSCIIKTHLSNLVSFSFVRSAQRDGNEMQNSVSCSANDFDDFQWTVVNSFVFAFAFAFVWMTFQDGDDRKNKVFG